MYEAAPCIRYARECLQVARSNNREGCYYYSTKNKRKQVRPLVRQFVKTVSG